MILALIIGLTICLLGYHFFNSTGTKVQNEILQKAIDNDAILIDVRTEMEFKNGNIPNTTHLSLSKIQKEEIPLLDKEKTYITYCAAGIRSKKAQLKLHDLGFKNVFDGGKLSNVKSLLKNKD